MQSIYSNAFFCDDKTASFFEFSLCLSRACLGKIIVFIYKWRKKTVLSPVSSRRFSRLRRLPPVPASQPARGSYSLVWLRRGVPQLRWSGACFGKFNTKPIIQTRLNLTDSPKNDER